MHVINVNGLVINLERFTSATVTENPYNGGKTLELECDNTTYQLDFNEDGVPALWAYLRNMAGTLVFGSEEPPLMSDGSDTAPDDSIKIPF